jgi:hypothetical protein
MKFRGIADDERAIVGTRRLHDAHIRLETSGPKPPLTNHR